MNKDALALGPLKLPHLFIAVSALCLSFVVAYAADASLQQLRKQSSISFELIRPAFFLAAVATLVPAAMTLALG